MDLHKQIHEKHIALISSREDFKEARKQNADLKASQKELVDAYEEKLAAFTTEPDHSHFYEEGTGKRTITKYEGTDSQELLVTYESKPEEEYQSEEESESESEEQYEWDSEEEESELFDREETRDEKEVRLRILSNIMKNRQMRDSGPKDSLAAIEMRLGSLFTLDNDSVKHKLKSVEKTDQGMLSHRT